MEISIDVNIINKSKHPLPEYKTKYSSGMDLCANITEPITLKPLERIKVPTGIFIELPVGYEAQIRPRSGLSLNKGIVAILGTIDSDYRGELGVIIVNLSNKEITINDGDRIAQLVCSKVIKMDLHETSKLTETERGDGGFGHTGLKNN